MSHALSSLPIMVSTALRLFDAAAAADDVVTIELVDDPATAVAVLEERAPEYARKSTTDTPAARILR